VAVLLIVNARGGAEPLSRRPAAIISPRIPERVARRLHPFFLDWGRLPGREKTLARGGRTSVIIPNEADSLMLTMVERRIVSFQSERLLHPVPPAQQPNSVYHSDYLKEPQNGYQSIRLRVA
jgi:hypothetical protein